MNTPIKGEVYFEFTQIGSSLKVAAIDQMTGLEVVIIGTPGVPIPRLQQLAMRKLEKRLRDLQNTS